MSEAQLPAYEVKVSARAKRPRLVLHNDQRLVVVIPKGFPKKMVAGLVEDHQLWLLRVAARVEALRESMGVEFLEEQQRSLPRRVSLRSIGEEWAIVYKETGSPRVELSEDFTEGQTRLLVAGNTSNEDACREALRRWLSWKAKRHLTPWLDGLAAELGYRYHDVAVRSQRTRWASYSRKGTVSLNLKLMFLPASLVRHVLIHELCHSVHLNHSREFWAVVAAHAPLYEEREAELKTAFKYVPRWVDMD